MGFDVAKLRFLVDSTGLKAADRDLAKFGQTSKEVGASAFTAAKMVRGLSGAAAALGAGAALGAAVDRSAQLASSLGEVSTLIEGTPEQMALLTKEVKALTGSYGGDMANKAAAFYQSISAGAKSVEDAAITVAQANKLAIGGMTDVATGVDGLTTAMNVFAEDALTASEASDAMFVGMRAGKTTIAELAGSLGRVAPIARDVGLSFDEMVAAIAATTKGGISTNEAVSGLKAALANVIKPSAEAEEAAKRLGIQFDTAAIKSKGLAGFMDDVRRATGGNIDEMSALFGSVEGLAVVASLAGAGFEDLVDILDDMKKKAGETDKAFEKVAETAPARIDMALGKLKAATTGIGDFGLEVQASTLEGLADAVGGFAIEMSNYRGTLEDAAEGTSWFAEMFGKDMTQIGTETGQMINVVRAAIDGEWRQAWKLAAEIPAIEFKPKETIWAKWVDAIWGDEAQAKVDETKQRMEDGFSAALDDHLRVLEEARLKVNGMYAEMVEAVAPVTQAEKLMGAWAQAGAGAGEAYADEFSRVAVTKILRANIAEAGFKMATGFEMAKSNLVQIGGEADASGDAIDGAAASADRLANALGVAVGEAQALKGYADGTNFNAPTGANGYAGATSNWFNVGNTPSYTTNVFGGTGPKGNFDLGAIKTQISTLQSLRDAGAATSRSIADDSRQISKALMEITDAIGDYSPENLRNALTGGADRPQFWESFKGLAISSWQDVMSQSFEPGGAAMGAVTAGLADAMGKVLETNLGRVNQALNSIPDTFDVMVKYGAGVDRYTFPVKEDSGVYNKFYNDAFGNLQVDELTDYGLKGTIGKNTRIKEFWAITTKKVQEEVTNEVNDILTDGADVLGGDFGIGNMPSTDIIKSGGVSIKSAGSARNVSFSERDVTRRDNRVSQQLSKIVGGIAGDIRDTVRIFSDAIGGNSDRINKVLIRFKASTGTGKDAIQNAKDILVGGIEDYSEALAKAVLKGRGDLKMAGEKWSEALERLAKDFWGIVNTMEMLGGQMFKNNLNGAKYASKLVQEFGTAEDFNTAATSFFSVAYSPAAQQKQLEKYARDALGALGINKMPTTREEYRDLVLKQDLTKERGREKYAALMNLAGLFDQILPAYEGAVDGAATAQERYNKTLTQVSGTLSGMISEAGVMADRYKAVAKSLRGTAEELRGMGRTNEQNIAALRLEYTQTFDKAMKGDIDAMNELGGVAKDYANVSKSSFGTSAEWRFFTTRMAAQLDSVAGVADEEEKMSRYEEKTLQALLDGVENGRITNELVRDANEAVNGLPEALVNKLNRLFKFDTGKDLNLKTKKDSSGAAGSDTSSASRDYTADKDGTAKGGNTDIKKGGKSDVDKLRDEVRKLMRREYREMRRGNRFQKRATKVLKDWDADGIPPERAA